MKLHVSFLLCFATLCFFLQGPLNAQRNPDALKLAAPISNHMVLQHGKATSIWGTVKPDSKVTVSFGEQSVEATADAKGHWKVTLEPLQVSTEPAKLVVTSEADETLTVKDILVGEVWMCSGQSNMAFVLNRTKDPAAVKAADLPMVRIFKTGSETSETVESDCKGRWKVVTPKTAADFSAVGYFFGRELHEELEVPIGLVDTSWGGKTVEAFTSFKKLKTVDHAKLLLEEWANISDNYDADEAKIEHEFAMKAWEKRCEKIKADADADSKPRLPRQPRMRVLPKLDPGFPGSIYNQKVAPWTNYAIAGSIWYQGEANSNRGVQYESLLTALIEDWRAQWDDEFPFYIVQLANFKQPTTEPGVPNPWAELQNAQTRVAQTVPGCGIAIANDIGTAGSIHPKNKRDVGHRLALLALKQHYDKDLEVFSSPLYKSHRVLDDHIVVTMEHVGAGLKSRDGEALKRFEVAGEDQKWHWADAKALSKNTIKVSSESVPKPVAVRYAWAANPEGANLVNSGGLPASIFRTDDWKLQSTNNFTRGDLGLTKKRLTRQGFKELFNGKDLKGWKNPFDYGNAEVVNGEIRLTADKKFFLVTEKKYSNFVAIVEIHLPQGKANSGVMFRCHVEPNKVYGYQAECDGSDRRWSAGLYDEGRRGWVWPSKKGRSKEEKFLEYEEESQAHFAQPKIRNALRRNGWNRYRITCRGDQITIELNGVKVTDIKDDTDAEGFLGIQHHGEKGQTYRFRNLFIKEVEVD